MKTASSFLFAGAICALAVSCSGPAQGAPTAIAPALVPVATATPLAVEPSVATNGSFYRPPGWDGVSDVNCTDFDSRAHAQSFFLGTLGSVTNDPYGLDGDHDGDACENLP
jgi:hypothetical protein